MTVLALLAMAVAVGLVASLLLFRGIGSFGCQTEPSCQTDRWGPWPMEALRSALEVGRG